MPYFIGLNEVEAQRRLDQAHLHKKINYVAAPQWPHGAVIDQTPLGGARIAATTEVELTIAN
jgi:beta-lactam-binding protein with PASTA domain